ncbi:hypothetical protein Tco_1343323 [Tanacetum coccineum]
MGLWYPKGSGFELTAFLDADHAGCIDTRKSTSGGIQFLGDKLVTGCQRSKTVLQCHQQRLNTWRYLQVVLKIECARSNPTANLPYGMFLTRLYRHIMEYYPHLDNGIYNVVDRVMRPLALKQTRKQRSDRGKARHSVSSTSAHHNCGSSSRQADDDEDDCASRASTPSPTTYLNSLKHLDY